MIRCILLGHIWEVAERPSKEGDFIAGWSPVYYYEQCCVCGKKRDDSPFSKKLTEKIERLNDRARRLKKSLRRSNSK